MAKILLRSDNGVCAAPSLRLGLGVPVGVTRWLFVAPHDDDAMIGAGLLMAQAAREGVEVHVAIVTDGGQGYCSLEQRENIREVRRREAIAGYGRLGLPGSQLHFLDFPDCQLGQYMGRRPAGPDDPSIGGYTGLENSFTHLIRALSPWGVFAPASTDLHPDHQNCHRSLMISLFHATGDIWPELGSPCHTPKVFEFPIYMKLAHPPDLMIEAGQEAFRGKLDAIACFASQRQIEILVEGIRQSGPVEFLRNVQFGFYQPEVYKSLFEAQP